MATYTPTSYQVWNELDEFGLLLDLPRIQDENNSTYKQRLFDVFVHRANSTYYGLINGITRELGLSMYHAMTVTPVWNGSVYAGDSPAIVFEETKCYVYDDYANTSLTTTIDRFGTSSSRYTTMEELVASINGSGYIYAALQDSSYSNKRAMEIFNQKSVNLVVSEELNKGGPVINLNHDSLLQGSVTISSTNLTDRVASQAAITKRGHYYIDHTLGIIYSFAAPEPGATIRYEYINPSLEVWASPVIIHDIQSTDFKEKMFEQILTSDATYTNGAPTSLGADLVNELMSVSAFAFGS